MSISNHPACRKISVKSYPLHYTIIITNASTMYIVHSITVRKVKGIPLRWWLVGALGLIMG